jgi:hypothetical protein
MRGFQHSGAAAQWPAVLIRVIPFERQQIDELRVWNV